VNAMTGALALRVKVASAIVAEPHAHEWRICEVEHLDCGALRRLECTCGAVDYETAA